MAMANADPLQSWNSSMRGSSHMTTGDSFMFDPVLLQKFKDQYSQYNDLRSSFASQLNTSSSQLDTRSGSSGKPTYVLNLHFLGLSGLPKAGWFERAPGYELIVHAGGVAKRIRPRIPAPPPGAGSEPVELEDFVPAEQLKVLQRLDDRASVRCNTPGEFFRVDVYEERTPLLDFSASHVKGSARVMLGQCYVPLEQKYNRRPCIWPIVSRTDKVLTEVGFLTCKFGLVTMPSPVQNLRIVEGTVGSKEAQLAWEPPESDGGTVLRAYRVEARMAGVRDANNPLAGIGPIGDETPVTASAPAVAEPSAVLRNLLGNTEYVFCVWAVSEAGPGAGSEVVGKTGAVTPGMCGPPHLAESSEGYFIQWMPPEEDGGADIIAYRVWLRALFHNSLGEIWPAESWVDLGLLEHQGEDSLGPQQTPLGHHLPPACSGCLGSVSALNSAGLLGASTPEVAIIVPESPQAQSAPRIPPRPPAIAQVGGNGFGTVNRSSSGPPLPEMQGDPLAHWHAPGALAEHQLQGDVGAIPRTVPSNVTHYGMAAAAATVQQTNQSYLNDAGPVMQASDQASLRMGRVVEPSEIRLAGEAAVQNVSMLNQTVLQQASGGLRSATDALENCRSRAAEVQQSVQMLNQTVLQQAAAATDGLDNLRSRAAEVGTTPTILESNNQFGGGNATSWGLGQKESLSAGHPSFVLR